MTTCSAHAQIPAGKPAAVSVNGVAIARDAIVREMQHHAAPKADRGLAAGRARAGHPRTAAAAGAPSRRHARADQRRRRPARDRRRSHHAGAGRTRGDGSGTGRRDLPALLREQPEPLPLARHLRGLAYPVRGTAGGPRGVCAGARGCRRGARRHCASTRSASPTLAQAHSRCPSAAQGGNLGQITAGQTTPEFEQALFALAPGQLCEAPVATRYGFHVIRLDRKHEGRTLPYELVAERIADYLRESVRRRADAQYIARLVSAARIEGIELAGADALRVH